MKENRGQSTERKREESVESELNRWNENDGHTNKWKRIEPQSILKFIMRSSFQ
jgi:hypothetical protein